MSLCLKIHAHLLLGVIAGDVQSLSLVTKDGEQPGKRQWDFSNNGSWAHEHEETPYQSANMGFIKAFAEHGGELARHFSEVVELLEEEIRGEMVVAGQGACFQDSWLKDFCGGGYARVPATGQLERGCDWI